MIAELQPYPAMKDSAVPWLGEVSEHSEMLRIEILLAMLCVPHSSVPANPLLAESLYLAKDIERMGTGTEDMIARCREAGLSEPQFALDGGFVLTLARLPESPLAAVTREVTQEVTPEGRLIRALVGPMTRRELQEALELEDDEHFRTAYLLPALEAGLVEMTIPDKPTSRLQKYPLTPKGRARLASLSKGQAP